MKLGEIYINKTTYKLIQIDSFACHMNHSEETDPLIIFRNIETDTENDVFGSIPSFNGYGSEKEILEDYDLLIDQESLNKIKSLNYMLEMIDAYHECKKET